MEDLKMTNNISGITLISLVMTIIVLLILVSITTYTGIDTIHSAQLTKFTIELKMMQQKVNELYDCYINGRVVTINGTDYVGKGEYANQHIENEQQQTIQIKQGVQDIGKHIEDYFTTNELETIFSIEKSGVTDKEGYKYYDEKTLQELGFTNMKYRFFVNVANRSVICTEGFHDGENIYYTLNQIPDGVYNVQYNNIEIN